MRAIRCRGTVHNSIRIRGSAAVLLAWMVLAAPGAAAEPASSPLGGPASSPLGPPRGAEPRRLLAGAAASNITPPLGVSINGNMHDQKAAHIHDELYARALVLDDGRGRVAIVVCDSCMIPREVLDEARTAAGKACGIAAERMLFSATHTHSAPAAASVFQSDEEPEYRRFLVSRIADAVRRAAANLAPASIGWGSGSVPHHVFNRRWRMKPGSIPPDPFGGRTDQVRMNPPAGSPDLVEPAGPTDPELVVISVRSAAGKPLAVLANYSLHYVGGAGPGHISADYFGMFADRVQELLGADRLDPPFVGILSNGTSGDINNIDFRGGRSTPSEVKQGGDKEKAPYARMRLVADDVAAEAVRVARSIDHRESVAIDAAWKRIQLGARKPSPAEAARAEEVLGAVKGRGLQSLEEIYARETLALGAYPETVDVPLQALRIGDIAVLAIPCEVFVEIGLELKRRSPIRPAFTVSLANGYFGYLPTPGHHDLGGYETWRARSSFLEKGASPRIVEALLELLDGFELDGKDELKRG